MRPPSDVTRSLLQLYRDAALGHFPPTDGAVTLLPSPPGPAPASILALTAHHVVAADVTDSWLATRVEGSLAAPMSTRFIVALEQVLGLHADSVDVLLAARGVGGRPSTLAEADDRAHVRVRRALRSRSDVRVYTGTDVILVLGRGAAERLEIAIEVEESARTRGVARRALTDALHLVDVGEPLFAQIAPGNAAALRAALGAGFAPIGGEILFFPETVGD